MLNANTPVISFVAPSGTGKTTLLERVVVKLKQSGLKIATIKHDAHRFDIDIPGKDSWKMAQAGADIVMIASAEKIAIIQKIDEEKELDDLISRIDKVDLILTEGFRISGKPKIEVHRSERSSELRSEPHELLAIASDITWQIGVPCYHIDDVDGVVETIMSYRETYDQTMQRRP
ncbi:molybdopterin-guanine dinucleotide biosynthesis protein B [Desulfitobacterium sp. PCE1]|uniref:molybdopterin-guanine dinucleotide biosynthesis protein B n=1 Tax=Desulfitobacterium sp. PCE1 TaxID=146907 RepID=UPI00037085D7|nr:molybdopterin-guanine dinucleotide biosynthesis protein B [Desulfitobacterium sp. PCE1]